jgi:hypothetical protein
LPSDGCSRIKEPSREAEAEAEATTEEAEAIDAESEAEADAEAEAEVEAEAAKPIEATTEEAGDMFWRDLFVSKDT